MLHLKRITKKRGKKMEIEKIAHIRTDFPTKFGLPRQSSIVKKLKGEIVFEPKYRTPDAIRGIEGYSHLWIVWGFSENDREGFYPTVRPPRLGGNARVGVFATRSPFRPNGLGLSLVRLEEVKKAGKNGHTLIVSGVDMVDKTPIYDIKPYLPNTDYAKDAIGGFADEVFDYSLKVECDKIPSTIDEEKAQILLEILAQDPRPSYIEDGERVYGFAFAEHEIKFKVSDKTLTVISIEKIEK